MSGPIMIDLKGYEISPEEETILKHPMVGGVILFFKNCKNNEQLKNLISNIRKLRPEILIAVDREGGNVQRFQKPGFRCFPAARIYGEIYDATKSTGDYWREFTKQNSGGIGAELKSLGIDINLAPVLDSHSESEVIGGLDRAFHTDSLVRTEIAKVFIQGLRDNGVKATGKHFPDHGVCEGDSHLTKPVSHIDRETLFEKHILPYRELIKRGLLDVIMPAHITYTAIDPENTAGFSKIWLNDILRKQLEFKGAVVSDCLSMAGADIGEMKTRAVQALEAGCDMAMMCNQTRELVLEVLNYLQENFKQSVDSKTRITVLMQRENKVQQIQSESKEEKPREMIWSNITPKAPEYAPIELTKGATDATPKKNFSLNTTT